jgi:uncharacterized membrane protein
MTKPRTGSIVRVATMCIVLGFGATATLGAVTVRALPISSNYSVALSVSNGGTYVTGYVQDSGVPAWPVLWTNGASPVNIEGSGGLTNALGESMSADGSVITGRFGSSSRPYRWTSASGMVPLPTPAGVASAWVTSVCGSGAAAVGGYTIGAVSTAAVWDSGGNRTARSPAPSDVGSTAWGASYDGGVIVGLTSDSSGNNRAARWDTGQFAPTILPGLPGMTDTFAKFVSADGGLVTGASATGNYDPHPVRWDAAGNVAMLPLLPGATYGSVDGLSADGSVILGQCWSTTVASRSVLWVDGSLVALDDLLIANGISPALARSLVGLGLSGDGQFISAYEPINAPTSRAYPYLIEIPAPGTIAIFAAALMSGAWGRRRRV